MKKGILMRKTSKRLELIRDLETELVQVTFNDKYSALTYFDIMQALAILNSSCIRWQRKSGGYRKLKTKE